MVQGFLGNMLGSSGEHVRHHLFSESNTCSEEEMGLNRFCLSKPGEVAILSLSEDQIHLVLVELCPLVHVSQEEGSSQNPRGSLEPSCMRKGLREGVPQEVTSLLWL